MIVNQFYNVHFYFVFENIILGFNIIQNITMILAPETIIITIVILFNSFFVLFWLFIIIGVTVGSKVGSVDGNSEDISDGLVFDDKGIFVGVPVAIFVG